MTEYEFQLKNLLKTASGISTGTGLMFYEDVKRRMEQFHYWFTEIICDECRRKAPPHLRRYFLDQMYAPEDIKNAN